MVFPGRRRISVCDLIAPCLAAGIFGLLTGISFFAPMGVDEGVWSYIGMVWVKYGLPPYAGSMDDKTPGIHLLYALSYLLWGVNYLFVRILGAGALGGAAAIVYLLVKRLYHARAGIITMLFFGLSMASMRVDGQFTAQTESFMVFWSLLSIFFLIKSLDEPQAPHRALRLFISGLCIGWALAFKQIAIFSAVSLLTWYACMPSSKTRKKPVRDLFFIATGCIGATVMSIAPLLMSGVSIAVYFENAWLLILRMFMMHNATAAPMDLRLSEFHSAWSSPDLLVYYPLIVLFVIQRQALIRRQVPWTALLVWMICEFLGVNAVGYYWGHQFKQIIPPFAVSSGIAVSILIDQTTRALTARHRWLVYSALACLILALWFPYKTIKYRLILSRGNNFSLLGKWLKENTHAGDYLYVFNRLERGAGIIIQAYSERRFPCRYSAPFCTDLPEAQHDIELSLYRLKPAYILIPQSIKIKVPSWLDELLHHHYQRLFIRYFYEVYKRIESK